MALLNRYWNQKALTKLNFINYSGNMNFKHTFDSTGREITADFDYVGYSQFCEIAA